MSGIDWNTWGPPLGVLAVGLVVGIVVAFRSGSDGAADPRQASREDLAARKASLVEQIRALDADVDKLDRAAFLAERSRLVRAAADALRGLDQVAQAPAPAPRPVADAAADRRALRAGLWVSLVAVFFAVLGLLLTESSKTRGAGDSLTGNTAQSVAQQESAEVVAARAALAANPDDLAAINTITYSALTTRKLDEAMAMIDRGRALDPANADVQLHLAILQISVGMLDKAEAGIAGAIAAEPGRGRFQLWLGLLRLYQGQSEAAVEAIENALKLGIRTDEQAFARQLLAEAKNPRPAAASAPVAPTGPTYSGPGGGGTMLAGTVALAAGTADDPAATVFVMVYPDAEQRRPVATLKLPASALPFAFAFEAGHAMGGAPWPDTVFVTAKIDADGAAGSGPGDVVIDRVGPLAAGSTGTTLALPGRGAPAAPAPAPAAATGAPRLSGRVALAEGVAAPADRTVFLMVYASPQGGRPVAAKKLTAGQLPLDFVFTDADAMMGGAWPDEVWIRARVDADGRPGASEGDIDSAMAGPFAPGATGVALLPGQP